MPKLTLPDGSTMEVPQGTTVRDVVERLGPRLAREAIAAKIDGEILDLCRPITRDGQFRVLTLDPADPDSLYVLRHSAAHVMAEAICSLWPEAKLVYGPPVDDGFYYDIDLDRPISANDFPAIEQRMAEIIRADRPFTRYELPREQAMEKLRQEGNRYKIDNAERAEGDTLSFYVTGDQPGRDFEDLCRGPHLPSTGRIKAFKVMQVSSAFYRGDAREKMLQRVYGTAWPSRQDLEAYLARLEEARKRDHRVLGRQLDIFTTSERVGPGLILWMPNGAIIRHELETFLRAELVRQGYQPVYTPHIGRLELYRTSGHYPYYQESQYPPIMEDEHEGYLLKPMNCPHHIEIYRARPHSYRDLPVRLAEFGTVYRYEQSGEVTGMLRVRGFTQDDAHLFCTPEQLEEEIEKTVRLTMFVLDVVGLAPSRIRVALRDPGSKKYVGSDENWDRAESNLLNVVRGMGLNYVEERGEAAFYGPKIDFVIRDVVGREWQLGTVQVDYNLPERFDLTYVGADNRHHRPVMIHRAPFGAMERFVAVLVEHFAGAFPLWLAPVQVRVASVSEKSAGYAQTVHRMLIEAGLRADVDVSPQKIGPKKHEARQRKIPFILVVGEREAAEQTVNVNDREGRNRGNMTVGQFVEVCRRLISSRQISLEF